MGNAADQSGADDRGILTEHIKKPKNSLEFSLGDEPPEVRTGQGLNSALKQPNGDGEHPEFPGAFEEKCSEQGDAEVSDDQMPSIRRVLCFAASLP